MSATYAGLLMHGLDPANPVHQKFYRLADAFDDLLDIAEKLPEVEKIKRENALLKRQLVDQRQFLIRLRSFLRTEWTHEDDQGVEFEFDYNQPSRWDDDEYWQGKFTPEDDDWRKHLLEALNELLDKPAKAENPK